MRVLKEKMRYKQKDYDINALADYFGWYDIDSWARDDVAMAVREKLYVTGYGALYLNTHEIMSRGEVAILLYRLYKRLW